MRVDALMRRKVQTVREDGSAAVREARAARRLEDGRWVESEARAYDPEAVYGGKS